jgi:serine protease inhibitor
MAMLFVGCAFQNEATNLMADVKTASWPEPPARMDAAYQTSVLDFTWRLFQETLGEEGNTLISPTSVYLALAMTMNGAQGDTLTAMKEALASANLSQETINAASRDLTRLLQHQTEKTNVSLANAIWLREQYPVAQPFLQANADYFAAAAQALDFESPQAVNTINGWVKKQTEGAIDSIVEQIDPSTMMYLMNAVYFKSDWQTPFDANSTYDAPFQNSIGETTASFMHRTDTLSYFISDQAQGVMLPYEDGKYQFFAILPGSSVNVRDYVRELQTGDLTTILQSMQTGQVMLSLPKFEVAYENRLKDELSKLGMGVAFTPQADFSRMNAQGQSDLLISDVVHKTFCRVDEQGTEAAAVTSVEMRLTSAPMTDVEIRFDRPFVYGIMDSTSATPLFLGLMEQPSIKQ